MTPKNLTAHVLGGLAILAAAGWLYLDVRPDGQVAMTTAAGCGGLALVGGFLIDKAKTGELVAFVASSLKQLLPSKSE